MTKDKWLNVGVPMAFLCLAGCAEHRVRELGLATQEVIGGDEADEGAWPWQAQIAVPGLAHYCGGSLIAPDWVLTAGHCVEGLNAGDFEVTLGEHDLTANGGVEQVRDVVEVVLHEDFDGSDVFNDVALLHLDSPVKLGEFARTIRLAVHGDNSGQDATVSGWGNTSSGSGASDVLMEAVLPIAAASSCNAAPNLFRDLEANEICAGFSDGESGGCHGDSGGPLVVSRGNGTWEQVGVVSWGQGFFCGTYTVFARVSSHADWVRKRVVDPAIFVAITG